MNYTELDVSQVQLQTIYNSTGVIKEGKEILPITYQGRPLIISIPKELKMETRPVYQREERVVINEKDEYELETSLQPTRDLVTTVMVTGPFLSFLLTLYEQLAKELENYNSQEGLIYTHKHKRGLKLYSHLKHFLNWSKDGTCFLALKVDFLQINPTVFRLDHLYQQGNKYRVALTAI